MLSFPDLDVTDEDLSTRATVSHNSADIAAGCLDRKLMSRIRHGSLTVQGT